MVLPARTQLQVAASTANMALCLPGAIRCLRFENNRVPSSDPRGTVRFLSMLFPAVKSADHKFKYPQRALRLAGDERFRRLHAQLAACFD